MDVTEVEARLSFDCRERTARADCVMRFAAHGGDAVFDLRQDISEAWLDGDPLEPGVLAHDDHDVRPVPEGLAEGDHELRLRYDLALPRTNDPLPIGWSAEARGVVFDLWMSDLHPGRYLESWIPAPLCHDRFTLSIDVELTGTSEPHAVFSNGEHAGSGVRYPPSYTSLSPMLVIVPEARVDVETGARGGVASVTAFKMAGPEIDLQDSVAMIERFLEHNAAVFGDYHFGSEFLAYLWGTARGMEYDGATTSSVAALEHEVFHSWFGRGVKPASANDGWIDEAFCVWYTAGPPRERQFALPFDWDEPPVLLRPGGPFDRYTPREAYSAGPRFFAGVAHALGGPEALVEAMAALYRDRAGGFLTTDELERALVEAGGGAAVTRAFRRWVHGEET